MIHQFDEEGFRFRYPDNWKLEREESDTIYDQGELELLAMLFGKHPLDMLRLEGQDAITLAGGPARVMTLADEHAADLGVAFSAPTPDRAPEALDQTMPLLASGALRLRRQRHLPMADAAEAHRLLERGEAHKKLILEAP